MRYDKQNKRLEKLQRELEEAKKLAAKAEGERARLYSVLDGIMHETRRLNAEVSSACEDLSRKISRGELGNIDDDADRIFYTSGLISSRLTFADFEINPQSIGRQTKVRAGIYKKFDKARMVLSRAARRKHLNIEFKGNSYIEIDAIPAFELVPFVLLDNAIKYSPDGQDVNVEFEDRPTQSCRVLAKITSVGPAVAPDEIGKLLDRGARGQNAIRSGISGEGIGLYLADTLTTLAGGRLTISPGSSSGYSVDGVRYANFTVTLEFR